MPSDLSRTWDQISHDLGWNDHNMSRDRPYNGQTHTLNGQRGARQIAGITMRDMRDCFVRAFILAHEYYEPGTLVRIEPNATLSDAARLGELAAITENDLYTLKGDTDPMAVAQMMMCEIERIMGVAWNDAQAR